MKKRKVIDVNDLPYMQNLDMNYDHKVAEFESLCRHNRSHLFSSRLSPAELDAQTDLMLDDELSSIGF